MILGILTTPRIVLVHGNRACYWFVTLATVFQVKDTGKSRTGKTCRTKYHNLSFYELNVYNFNNIENNLSEAADVTHDTVSPKRWQNDFEYNVKCTGLIK